MTTHSGHHDTRVRRLLAVLLVLLLLLLVSGAAALAAAGVSRPHAAAAPDTITPAMIALGDSVYHGRVGGAICATCHGKDAKGVPGLGPDLTDRTWLHGDGSLAFLVAVIRGGVAAPKRSAATMPPFGGVPLTEAQLQAVAAYVYSLGRPRAG